MRAAFPYLAQARTADLHQTAEHDRLARSASQVRHTGAPRGYRARGLPAMVARRVLTVLGGGSP